MSEEKPQSYWVFSIRVGTLRQGMSTKKMIQRMQTQLYKIAGIVTLEILEDFEKDPLKPLPIDALFTSQKSSVVPNLTRKEEAKE
jgi:hypothetical protein